MSVADPLATLFIPLESGAIAASGRVLFLNAAYAPGLSLFNGADLSLQQCDCGVARALETGGYAVSADLPPDGVCFDLVLLHAPKNHAEALYLMGAALMRLAPGGMILCAAAGDAGGKRLAGDLEKAGLAVEKISKHKARAVWAKKTDALKEDVVSEWIADGAPQEQNGFITQPGIFGWDKIDAGSALLLSHLPGDLAGTGADFGCGYGFLAHAVLRDNPAVARLYVIDSDARAVAACAENTKDFSGKVTALWDDLRALGENLPPLDFIVMNPPFHSGKDTQIDLGRAFIRSAAAVLKPGGALWMVANAHLPYEQLLAEMFGRVKIITEQNGFKIIHAKK